MTLAVLFPPSPAAPLLLHTGEPLTEHLAEQLRRAGAREVVVAGDLDDVVELAESAGRAGEPLLLCSGDLVAHTAVLHHLATHPAAASAALVLADGPPEPRHAVVAEDRGQVVAAGAVEALPGEPSGTFGGALRVVAGDLPALAAAARPGAAGSGAALPALDRLLAALTRGGVTIISHRVRLLVARRVTAP
ncbi:MAG TPA: CDP-alcohol phosphatidyltransferase family protein, partial [Micromonosporaceae bacterium]|nr:CDP-alcohol phosphatidyltransferase family protein [Micromonosporaceae bacterium]